MKKSILYTQVNDQDMQGIFGGGRSDGDLFYDVSYLLGYGLGWISNFIGQHSQTYGIAFK